MRNSDHTVLQTNHIKSVLFLFSTSTPARSAGPALGNYYSLIPVIAGVEIERIANVGAVQVTAQNRINAQFNETHDGALSFWHR